MFQKANIPSVHFALQRKGPPKLNSSWMTPGIQAKHSGQSHHLIEAGSKANDANHEIHCFTLLLNHFSGNRHSWGLEMSIANTHRHSGQRVNVETNHYGVISFVGRFLDSCCRSG
jgi:hypothetical protein